MRVEYHMFPKATFCSGAAFVPKGGGLEDDGWIITYVHHEDTNISQVSHCLSQKPMMHVQFMVILSLKKTK